MPEAGRSAKGFQDSAVQSGGGTAPQDDTDDAAPHGPAGDGAKSADPPPAEETDEPDRVAIVELETTQLVAEFDLMMPAAEGKALSPYPDFPETNPFRLAVREPAPPQPPPPPPSVRVRPPSGSQLARRRGSPSDLTVVLPNVSAGTGSGAALLAQRAVGDCEPELAALGGGDGDGLHHLHRRGRGEMERRDSIWDRLPPPDQLEQRRLSDCQDSASGAGRLLRSPFPQLGQPAPTPDQTNDEGRELFLEFVHDRIVEEGIPEAELALQAQNDDTINRIMCLPGLSNPVWAQTGTELRALADAFATSHQRQELRSKAQCTDLTDISWDRFRQLLEELFSGEAGVTQERILVLFFFLSDCVVSTIRRHAWTHLRRLIEWSLRYIVERVCALVQEAGGWGVVLRQSAEYLYLGLKITALSLVCVAAFVYIRKH